MQMFLRPLVGLNGSSETILQTGLDLKIFMSFVPQPRFVFATRIGMGFNFGNYAFQQAQYLSGTDNLRGYRKERFAGKSMFFNNLEVRYKLFDFPTYIFSGSFGLLAFNDVGRVWTGNEDSNKWHDGYGGGVWLSPYGRFVIAASLAYSKEEKGLPLVTFGFQF